MFLIEGKVYPFKHNPSLLSKVRDKMFSLNFRNSLSLVSQSLKYNEEIIKIKKKITIRKIFQENEAKWKISNDHLNLSFHFWRFSIWVWFKLFFIKYYSDKSRMKFLREIWDLRSSMKLMTPSSSISSLKINH